MAHDDETKQRLLAAAHALFDATSQLVDAAKVCSYELTFIFTNEINIFRMYLFELFDAKKFNTNL